MDLTGKKILVVEDDDMNYIYLTQLFKIIKGDFQRAKTGHEALRLAESTIFDLVLMDLQLPDISGIEITQQMKEKYPGIIIVAQTASRNISEIQQAKDAGCDDVLTKPFKINDFKAVVAKALNL